MLPLAPAFCGGSQHDMLNCCAAEGMQTPYVVHQQQPKPLSAVQKNHILVKGAQGEYLEGGVLVKPSLVHGLSAQW